MGVLDGIKILELARVPPAEMPGMMFADMGADVLKIETPDPHRDDSLEAQRREAFAFVNRNKRSLSLNLKAPEGQAIFRTLATTADVIVEGFRPGVMKRLGADYETIRALNPRIVYCSLSGFGQDRSEEHTSELQSHHDLVCRLLLEKKKINTNTNIYIK